MRWHKAKSKSKQLEAVQHATTKDQKEISLQSFYTPHYSPPFFALNL